MIHQIRQTFPLPNFSAIRYSIQKLKHNILEPNYANVVINSSNKVIYETWHNCSSYGNAVEYNGLNALHFGAMLKRACTHTYNR